MRDPTTPPLACGISSDRVGRGAGFSDYSGVPGVNWSRLKLLRSSAFRYKYALDNPEANRDTDALRLGRAVHTATFEPGRFLLEYVIAPEVDRRTKEGKAEWAAFVDASEGRTVLTMAAYTRAWAISRRVRAHPLVAPYLTKGLAEHTLTWTDEATGLDCKCRLDFLSQSFPRLLDLKTARDIDPDRFGAAANRLGYHCQLAHYIAGCEANGLLVHPGRASLVVVESEPPHEVVVYDLDEADLEVGRAEVDRLLALLKRCQDEDRWPERFETPQPLKLPYWIFGDDEDPEEMGFTPTGGFTR